MSVRMMWRQKLQKGLVFGVSAGLAASLSLAGCGKKADGGKAPANAAAPEKAGEKAGEKAADKAPAEAGDKPLAAIDRAMLGAFKPLPKNFDSETNPPSDTKLRLGHMLYFDARFSRSGTIACNSCHKLDSFGVDHLATSPGHAGKFGDRNSPTVFNAAGQFRQFWDGREPDVEGQAKGPVLNPVEHGLKDAAEVEQILSAIPEYVALFKHAFPKDGDKAVTFDNFAKAIGAFERKLVTPAPWDAFLAGDDKALTDDQKKGARLFVETGCITCHNGPLLGGTTYQKLGKVKAWPRPEDPGRKKVTGKDEDLHVFKVPTLRNVTKTQPYFHDGKTASLSEAVKLMARHQLGKELSDADVALIVAFLDSLTGTPPADWTRKPKLPKTPASAGAAVEVGAAPVKAKPVKEKVAAPVPDLVPKAEPTAGSAPEPVPPKDDHPPKAK